MPTSRVILVLYAFVATTNVMASGTGNDSLFWATKPLLMPLLAGIVVFAGPAVWPRPASRWLVAGLVAATAGDVLLMIDGLFYPGVAAFALCHIAYLVAFAKAGVWRRLSRPPLIAVPIGYALVLVGVTLVLRPAPALIGYGVLLALVATSAAGLGWRSGLGGALFLVSDLLIGIGLEGSAWPVAVMLTYVVGQALLVLGWLHHWERPAAIIPGPRPAPSDQQVRAE
jgi:uncharacterized membrane protein YhhN